MSLDTMIEDCSNEQLAHNEAVKDSLVESLALCKADCSFLTVAINRTLDFTKGTSNVGMCNYFLSSYSK